jgi:hypothetical protein
MATRCLTSPDTHPGQHASGSNAFSSFLEKNKASQTNDLCILLFQKRSKSVLFRFAEDVDEKFLLVKSRRAKAFGSFSGKEQS